MENLTRKEILKIFYKATMEALGHDSGKAYGTKKPLVRLTYSTFGKPDWTIDEDVVFLTFSDISGDDTSLPVHEEWIDAGRDLIRRHWTNRVFQISFTAYGPNGYDNLLKVRHHFMDGVPLLKKVAIYLIPSADTPQYVPENYQNMWWDRADLSLRFNHAMSWDEEIRAIEKVPVTIVDNPQQTTKTGETGIIIKKG